MKLLKKIRKGFTLIELVVVIAVIAILAAVSVVSYVSITNKAKQSNDQQKVDQVNLSLAALEISGKPKTTYEAVKAVEDDGFMPDKFKEEAKDYRFAYAMEENKFVIVEKMNKVVYPKDMTSLACPAANLWLFEDAEGTFDDGFSRYFRGKALSGAIKNSAGVDVGENVGVSTVTYQSTSSDSVVIRTNGDQTVLNVYAPSANVDYYGFAKSINVADVAPHSLHIFGAVNELCLVSGHVEVESTGIVFDVVQYGSTEDHAAPGNEGTISNKGYIAETSYSNHTSGEGGTAPSQAQIDAAQAKIDNDPGSTKTVGGAYEIGSLAQLEAFRDAVNAGNNFKGLSVKLTSNITLKEGWKPIGEGTRDVAGANTAATGTGTFFRGTFDGQRHTISNLNNTGFEPTEARIVDDEGKKTYAYGLFALVGSEAEICNVKLDRVDIDQSRYSGAVLDSVGSLIGYADGKVKVSNVEASGKIIGRDAVGGIVGRVYNKTFDYSGANAKVVFEDCTNRVDISSQRYHGGGIVGYISLTKTNLTIEVKNNTNYGSIFAKSGDSSGIACYAASSSITITVTGNENKGGVSTNSAGRAAHIMSVINAHKVGSTSTIDPNLIPKFTYSDNSHSATALVTLAAAGTPDTSTADHHIVFWNDGSGRLSYLD